MPDPDKNTVRSLSGLSNRQRLGFLLSDTMLYGVSAAVSRAMSMVTLLVLARYLSVDEYGVLDYFTVFSGLLVTLFAFGQDSAIARYFYEYEDVPSRRQLISQSLVFQLLIFALLLPITWALRATLWFLPDSEHSDGLLLIVILQLPMVLLFNFSQNLLKWTFARKQFLILTLGFSVLQSLVLILGAGVFQLTLTQMFSLTLISYGVFATVGIVSVRHWLTVPKGFKYIREMLPYAIPYGVISGLAAFLPTFERSAIEYNLSTYQLGIYAIAARIILFVGLIVTAFQTAWGPFAYSQHKNRNAIFGTFNTVLKVYTLGICAMTLLVSLLAHDLLHILVSEKYAAAAPVVFPLAMGLAVHSIGMITELGIDIARRSHLKIYAYLANTFVTIAGIVVLSPVFGLIGVAYSVLAGFITRTLLSTWLAQRAEPLPWIYWPTSLIVSLTIAVGLLSTGAEATFGPSARSITLFAGLVMLPLGFWVFVLVASERKQVIELVGRRLRRVRQ